MVTLLVKETNKGRATNLLATGSMTNGVVASSCQRQSLRAMLIGYAMAYAGNGTFVIVSGKASLESSVGLEAEIQALLDENCAEYNNGDPMEISVCLGNPIRPSTNKTQRIRKTFDRAIARAESRAMKKEKDPRPHNNCMFRAPAIVPLDVSRYRL